MGEPGPSGSPASYATARRDVVVTLHQVIDNLTELSNSIPDVRPLTDSRETPLLLDASEAAKLLSLSRSKVCSMAGRGEIPSIRIGRAMRIPRDPLLAWIQESTMAPSLEAGLGLPKWAYLDRSKEL